MLTKIGELINKEVILLIRYGSYNYNLNTKNSDYDYRGFIKKEEGFKGLNFAMDNNYDICVNTLDQFLTHLMEMNPKYLELLFSDTIYISPHFTELKLLFSMSNDIAQMDLPAMYERYIGEHRLHQEYIKNNLKPHKNLGYAIHSYRFLDILERFHSADFTNYSYAIKYGENDVSRKLILSAKEGTISLDELNYQIQAKYKKVLKLESDFNKECLTGTKEKLTIILQGGD